MATSMSCELFDCAVCLEDMTSKSPRFLNCGHAFCQPCLDGLYKNNTSIACPTCRTITSVPEKTLSKLPSNLYIQRVIRNKKYNCVMCFTEKIKTKAVLSCVECGENMCNQCKEYHCKIPIFALHTFTELEAKINTCSIHGCPVTFCCLECYQQLCVQCTCDVQHEKHTDKITDINNGIKTVKTELDDLQGECEALIIDMKGIAIHFSSKEGDIKEYAQQNVNNLFQKIDNIKAKEGPEILNEWKELKEDADIIKYQCSALLNTQKAFAEYPNLNQTISSTINMDQIDINKKPELVKVYDNKSYIGQPSDVACLHDGTIVFVDEGFNCVSRLHREHGLIQRYYLPVGQKVTSLAVGSNSFFVASEHGVLDIPFSFQSQDQEFHDIGLGYQIRKLCVAESDELLYFTCNCSCCSFYEYNLKAKCVTRQFDDDDDEIFDDEILMFTNTSYLNGRFVIACSGNQEVYILDKDFTLTDKLYGVSEPCGMAVIGYVLLIADIGNDCISAFDIRNNYEKLGDILTTQDGIKSPAGLAYQQPYLYVTEYNNAAVKCFKVK